MKNICKVYFIFSFPRKEAYRVMSDRYQNLLCDRLESCHNAFAKFRDVRQTGIEILSFEGEILEVEWEKLNLIFQVLVSTEGRLLLHSP